MKQSTTGGTAGAMRMMCACLICMLLITACHKNDNPPTPPVHKDTTCQITDIKDVFNTETTITYDSLNHPLSLNYQGPPSYAFDRRFIYDANHRLVYIIDSDEQVESTGYVWQYHQLYYDNQNHIIGDSSLWGAKLVNGVPTAGPSTLRYHRTFAYDSLGRIILATELFAAQVIPDSTHYYYNGAGNLDSAVTITATGHEVTAYSTYDSNMNMYATNPVWQFITRDYSKNNRPTGTASQFNSQHLLTQVTDPADPFFIDEAFSSVTTVTYQCK
jgi:hypothetical protein